MNLSAALSGLFFAAVAFAAVPASAQDDLSGKEAIEACNERFVACDAAYTAYRDGIGVRPDHKRAQNILEKGCNLDSVLIFAKLCDIRAEQFWKQGDRDLAVRYSTESCAPFRRNLNADETEQMLAICNNVMVFVSKNLSRVSQPWPGLSDIGNFESRLQRWCDEGTVRACTFAGSLGVIRAEAPNSNIPPAQSLPYLRKGCDGDDLFACSWVLSFYKKNAPVTQAFTASLCAKGNAQSCGKLGFDPEGMTFRQIAERVGYSGIDPTIPAAQQLLAANHAIANGQAAIGTATLRQLAYEGYKPALYRLGWMTLSGEAGIEADDVSAADLLARSEYPDGHYAAALIYAKYDDERNFVTQMTNAAFGEHPQARAWYDAEQTAQRERSEAIGRELKAQTQANRLAESEMMRSAIDRAMNNYYQPVATEQRVCANIIVGGRMTRECMAESTFDRYYRP